MSRGSKDRGLCCHQTTDENLLFFSKLLTSKFNGLMKRHETQVVSLLPVCVCVSSLSSLQITDYICFFKFFILTLHFGIVAHLPLTVVTLEHKKQLPEASSQQPVYFYLHLCTWHLCDL